MSRARLQPQFDANPVHHWRQDLPAALVVFLVALPLCLGIALASGAPLFSGIIAGVVGGVVVASFSGSELSVSGPAAGLAVIVAGSIATIGSFEQFLVAVMLAGGLQLGMAYLRMGGFGNYIPNAVIKGMLAAIGLVIMLKQIPHALGRDVDAEGDMEFVQPADGLNTFEEIMVAVQTANGEAVVITILSLAVLLFWDKLAKRAAVLKLIPAPLVVVVLGIAINEIFRINFQDFYLRAEDKHLVSLPVSQNGIAGFFGFFTLPDFGGLANPNVYKVAITLALVASIESILSVEATDKLDPQNRISNNNQELLAQGLGNMLSGLIGGIAVTSVVVRSSANIYAGARTRLSALLHGLLLLLCVALIPSWLNLIPLASLACILLVVGYKLAKPSLFIDIYRAGFSQFLPFIVTVLAIVFIDLLWGVLLGIAFGFVFVLRITLKSAMTLVNEGHHYLLVFNKDILFIHKEELKNKLRHIPDGAALVIDAHKSLYMDPDILEELILFMENAPYRHIEVSTKHLDVHMEKFHIPTHTH